jgi:hypothetical protein
LKTHCKRVSNSSSEIMLLLLKELSKNQNYSSFLAIRYTSTRLTSKQRRLKFLKVSSHFCQSFNIDQNCIGFFLSD